MLNHLYVMHCGINLEALDTDGVAKLLSDTATQTVTIIITFFNSPVKDRKPPGIPLEGKTIHN